MATPNESMYNWLHQGDNDYDAAIEMGFDEPPEYRGEPPLVSGVSTSPISPAPLVSTPELAMPPQLNIDTEKLANESVEKKINKDTGFDADEWAHIRSDSNLDAQYERNIGFETLNNGSTLDFILPQYGVADFINERALWQKGVHNLTGEPGWFYFKIFFNFQDKKGLFGGIMTDEIPVTSAIRYLYGIRNFYKNSKIKDRILALTRFTYTLSYINSVSPWFFIGINNANKLNSLNFNELTKEKSIDIVCNGEAIDMRLNTLLDMYRYACYDEINQKEIIPENLRKFDMSIVIMNAPIKYFQTAMLASAKTSKLGQVGHNGSTILNKAISGINKISGLLAGSSSDTFDFKNINGSNNNIDNMLSFQMYTLKNCEIDPVSFESYIPGNMNNSQFIKQGMGAIKIKYDRCYKHTFNEWTQMLYGTTGILYDMNASKLIGAHQNLVNKSLDGQTYNIKFNSNINNQRIAAIQKSIYNSFFDTDADTYKGLIDFSEAIIQDSLINVKDPNYLGNIAENYDETNWEDRWNKAKDKVKTFFTNPLDIF